MEETKYEILNPYIYQADNLINDFKLQYHLEIKNKSDIKILFDNFLYKKCFNDKSNNLKFYLFIKKNQNYILDIFIQERINQLVLHFDDDDQLTKY